MYIAGGAVIFVFFALCLAGPLFDAPYSPVLYDRWGNLLGARVAGDGQWRFPPAISVNEKFAASLVEYEDRRFFYHTGVDFLAAGRAFIQNIRAGRVVSGASTLTMQTVRLIRGKKKRTLFEKIIEAALAVRLEAGRSKEEILALYAANAPFGGNVVGLDAAAWRWYGRSASELSWGEAATLAVLPNGPGLVHPGRNRAALKEKRDRLLVRLAQRGHFDDETLRLAQAEPLPAEPLPLPRLAPHLLDRIIREEAAKKRTSSSFASPESSYGDYAERSRGRFTTTLDAGIQARAAVILDRWSSVFSGNGIMNAACVILDTSSGEALAYVGNSSAHEAADVDIASSPRSSGSLLKPFLYAAMLDSGELMPAGLVSDIPTRIGSYSPENNSRFYSGVIPANQALARSLNVPAVRELRSFGVERFARFLRQLGLTTLFRPGDEYGLPLILGGAEVTLWEIAGLYAGLGRSAQPDREEAAFFAPRYFPRPAPKAQGKTLLSAGAAWLTLDALTSVVRPGEEAAWQTYASSRRIAWKTGTSFGLRDAWAVGLTPRWTVAVWVGNASGEGRAELRGATTAAPLLFELFSFLESSAWFTKPAAELSPARVCAASGLPQGPYCENAKYTDIPAGASAHESCRFCRSVVLNESGSRQALLTAGTAEKTTVRGWFVLPAAEEWYYRRWNLDYKPLPPGPGQERGMSPLALFTPEEGSEVYVPIEIDGSPGRLALLAGHRDAAAEIHWHLDQTYLGSTRGFHEMETRPQSGRRTLTLVDNSGNTLSRRFTVLDRAD